MSSTKWTVCMLAVVLGLSACSKQHDEMSAKMHAIKNEDMPTVCLVSNAWARSTVPEQKTSAAYMNIEPYMDGKLVGVISDVAGVSEIHSMRMDGDVMKMRKVDTVDLKKGMAFDLAPNGYHVMLMDLKHQLKAGEKVHLTLYFEKPDGTKVQVPVQAEVLDQAPQGESDSMSGMKH